ncbi:DUF6020 family protein [Butyrivibrio sp. WCD3002]|uniref:DUF6020 family protein n=1 Tax=Butyrivibrio sp. WCD3002 TaxID=1280676 RepID=UPI0003F92A42|nr:DUF6020 family protein [Butyrivibrio sp. WCD3002]
MRNQSNRNKTWLLPVLFGVLLSLSITWGYQLEHYDHIVLTDIKGIVVFAILAMGFALLVHFSWVFLDRRDVRLSRSEEQIHVVHKREMSKYNGYDRGCFLAVWFAIALFSFIVLLGVYPGFFVYDAQTEVTEVLTRSFNTHHPLLHVLMLGGSVAFFHKLTGSYNVGIFAYTVLQMLVMTWIFTYIISFMKRHGAGRRLRTATALFFGIFPTVVMYTLCSSKDGLFSAFLVLTVILILEWEELSGNDKKKCKQRQIIISALLMMLFRHNGLYAYLVFAVFVMIAGREKQKKSVIKHGRKVFLIVPIVLYLVINTVMGAALKAESGEHQEMLTVPIQQLARTYVYEGDELSEEDKAAIVSYLSEEGLTHYTPRISDILKIYFNNSLYESDRVGFWKLWAKLFIQHPMCYVNAWFLTSYGYWYPGAVINVYQGNTVFTFTYKDSSYFGYEVELPGERSSFIPVIDDFYRKLSIERFQQNIPVISLLFSPAAYFFGCLYLFMTAHHRKKELLYPYLLIMLVWMTVLLGPTYLVRYVVYLWYIIPVLFQVGALQVEEL